MSADLDRVVFDTSRAAEFLEKRALQSQTGQPAERFGDVVLKELADNALDAAESAKVAPEIEVSRAVEGELARITVADNGPGIPAGVVERILDFNVLVSDKAAYRSPTRGLQGNALKTLLGIPCALGVAAPVCIEACSVRHEIAVSIDPGGHVAVHYEQEASPRTTGTSVSIPLPAELKVDVARWTRRFAVFNPHAALIDHGSSGLPEAPRIYKPSIDGAWRKPLPTDRTSPHWYDETALKRLVFAHIGGSRNGHRDLPLGEFVRSFNGLSSPTKAKAVAAALPDITHLSGFESSPDAITALLAAMRAEAKILKPAVLGRVPEDHYRARLDDWFGVERFWFKRKTVIEDGVPWLLELAIAVTERPGGVFYGINYSPSFRDPLARTSFPSHELSGMGAEGFLRQSDAFPSHENDYRRAAVVHVVCPALEFLDKGKATLEVPDGDR
jgi:DNA topoisomerase VI subunit B